MQLLTTFLLLLVLAASSSADEPEKPNIVLIVGDDHGYLDFGFMGSPVVQTPNLDRLAAQGTVFTHGYATASICRPSLQSLLTGLQPLQWDARIRALARRGVRRRRYAAISDFDTVPGILADEGYASFQAGKYGYESFEQAGFSDGMQRMGDPVEFGGSGRMIGRDKLDPVYAFIDRHRDEPFFLWFAPMLPHAPHDAGPRYQALYRDAQLSSAARAYYANITRFDDVVGQLIGFLEARDLASRTLVVYVADNGWDQGPRAAHAPDARRSLDGPRGKGSIYELGFRSPIIFYAPGLVPAGRVLDELVSVVDLFPTLLDYAGVEARSSRPGRSLRPLVAGGRPRGWRSRPVIGSKETLISAPGWERGSRGAPKHAAYFLRTPDWRYVWNAQLNTRELYAIERDPREETDVLAENYNIGVRLHGLVIEWRRAMLHSIRWSRDRGATSGLDAAPKPPAPDATPTRAGPAPPGRVRSR